MTESAAREKKGNKSGATMQEKRKPRNTPKTRKKQKGIGEPGGRLVGGFLTP
jgi:hypothetical protein